MLKLEILAEALLVFWAIRLAFSSGQLFEPLSDD
jgi:hypothetical protein